MDLQNSTQPLASELPRPLTRAEIDRLIRQAHRDRAQAQAMLIRAAGRGLAALARQVADLVRGRGLPEPRGTSAASAR